MHPGFHVWWQMGREAASRARAHAQAHAQSEVRSWCGPGHGEHSGGFGGHSGSDFGAGFGVRRPLRYLAWKLELEEEQIEKLAKVIETLKTERAQADLDFRRSTTAIADAVSATDLDAAALNAAAEQRIKSEERRQRAVVSAIEQMHAILDPEQKRKLAYLLRTGALQL
jgi:Spy/CpxP family protein refolding chaperone